MCIRDRYYRLVHLYGDVPFLNIEHTAPKIDFYTHSRKTILAKIEEDLAWAVQWLPKTVVPGAVSKAAGNHLLTKIYLSNGKFTEAVDASSAVINDGIHFLMTDRFGVDAVSYTHLGFEAVADEVARIDPDIVMFSEASNKEGALFVPRMLDALRERGKIYYGQGSSLDRCV